MKKDNSNLELNIIGVKTQINGDISSSGDLRIDGIVDGNITTSAKVVIGAQSKVTGNINAKHASISGYIKGDIQCSENITLHGSADITGNIATGKIIIENGAKFNGSCTMGVSKETTTKPQAAKNEA